MRSVSSRHALKPESLLLRAGISSLQVAYPFMESSNLVNLSAYVASGVSCEVLTWNSRQLLSSAYLPLPLSVLLAEDWWTLSWVYGLALVISCLGTLLMQPPGWAKGPGAPGRPFEHDLLAFPFTPMVLVVGNHSAGKPAPRSLVASGLKSCPLRWPRAVFPFADGAMRADYSRERSVSLGASGALAALAAASSAVL